MEHTFTIARDHPALAGHFPGNPIVPGVVLLDEIASALQILRPEIELVGLPNAKFLSPLRPSETCTVHFTPGRNDHIKFDCTSDNRVVASGSFAVKDKP